MKTIIHPQKQLFTVLICLYFFVGANAQLWQQEIVPTPIFLPPPNFEMYTNGYDIQETSDGNYVFAGRYQSGISPNFVYQPVLAKVNAATGAILWEKSYEFFEDGYMQEVSLIEKPNGNLLLAGLENNSIFLIETDDVGDTISTKRIMSDCEMSITGWCSLSTIRLRATSDGNYIIGVGSTAGMIGMPLPINQLIKIDPNNTIIWNKAYYDRFLLDFQPTNDGGYVMSGATSVSEPIIFKVDMNGDSVWQHNHSIGQLVYNLNSVQETPDKGYVVAYNMSGFAGTSAMLMKLDSSGANVLWQVPASSSLGDSKHVSLDGNGNYIVTGSQMVAHGGGLAVMIEVAFVSKISPSGIMLQTQYFDDLRTNVGTVVRYTSDGNFVMVGSLATTSSILNRGYIVKTGYWLSTKEVQKTTSSLDIFPNPLETTATLKIGEEYEQLNLTIYDALGREVQQVQGLYTQQLIIERNNLESGVYFFKVLGDNQLIGTGKFIVR